MTEGPKKRCPRCGKMVHVAVKKHTCGHWFYRHTKPRGTPSRSSGVFDNRGMLKPLSEVTQ